MSIFQSVSLIRELRYLYLNLEQIQVVSFVPVVGLILMDSVHNDIKDANGYDGGLLETIMDYPKDEEQSDGEEESDSNSLLPPRTGGMSRKSDKIRRKVQWNDRNGNKLAEIKEFEPSEVGDSDDEDSDSCVCTIM